MIGPRIVRRIARPPKEQVAALARFGVATIHEGYRKRGLMDHAIKPVVQGLRIAGPAVTSLCPAGDNLMLHASIAVAEPGDVLVSAVVSPNTDGMLGELIATQCVARGIAGVVMDAGARDTADLRGMRFGVWSRAVSASGTNKVNPGWVNVPVVVGGVTVSPGDIVVADDDGVVVVAMADAAEVIAGCEARETNEARTRARYKNGELSMDVNDLWAVVDKLGVKRD